MCWSSLSSRAVRGRAVPWAECSQDSDLQLSTGQGPGQHGGPRARGTGRSEAALAGSAVAKPPKGQGPRPRPCKPRVDLKAAWTEAGLGAAGCRCFQQGDRVTVTSAECSGPSGLQVPLLGTPHPCCCASHITHTSLRRLTVGRSSEGS